MKTILKNDLLNTLESSIIRATPPALPFGAGYRQFLTSCMDDGDDAIRPDEIPTPFRQPVRYLGAVEPMMDEVSSAWEQAGQGVRQLIGDQIGAALVIAAKPTLQSLCMKDALANLRRSLSAA